MNEVEKVFGRNLIAEAENQANNVAHHPQIKPLVESDTDLLIQKGFIDPNGPTATTRMMAIAGESVCTDDVATEDR